MIVTECPHCDRPRLFTVRHGEAGVFAPQTCDECGGEFVIEVTRTDGTTYPREDFEQNVLPELNDVEHVEHPDGAAELYCDPNKLTWGSA